MSLSASMVCLSSSQNALPAQGGFNFRGLRAPPNSRQAPEETSPTPLITHSEVEEEINPRQSEQCHHLPTTNDQHNLLPCETCNTVNAAIIRLHSYKNQLKAKANQHLARARQSLPRLFFSAMQQSTLVSRDDGTVHDGGGAEHERVKEFKKYNRLFEHWCDILGLDNEEAWREYAGLRPTEAATRE